MPSQIRATHKFLHDDNQQGLVLTGEVVKATIDSPVKIVWSPSLYYTTTINI